jgi:hypothetical protein
LIYIYIISGIEHPLDIALVTLLHLLVFAYWLGGDLGAFYSSTVLTNPAKSAQARIAAAGILSAVDMAPRTALILTLPTGLTLAAMKSWLTLPAMAVVGVWIGSLLWLAAAWTIHLRHLPPSAVLRRLDLGVRWVLVAFLVFVGTGVVAPFGPVPTFLKLKMLLLAAAICCGLYIRVLLAPFGAAFGQLVSAGASPETDARISKILNSARPVVMLLWGILVAAALIGVLKTP